MLVRVFCFAAIPIFLPHTIYIGCESRPGKFPICEVSENGQRPDAAQTINGKHCPQHQICQPTTSQALQNEFPHNIPGLSVFQCLNAVSSLRLFRLPTTLW